LKLLEKIPRYCCDYYEKLFDWRTSTDPTVPPEVSNKGSYGFINRIATGDGAGILGEIRGAKLFEAIPFVASPRAGNLG